MKGIYLTEEAKAEIEDKIAELEKKCLLILRAANSDKEFEMMQSVAYAKNKEIIYSLKEILSSATILPVEKTWQDVKNESLFTKVEEKYPNGVIIQKL